MDSTYIAIPEPTSPSEMSNLTQDQLIGLNAQRMERQTRADLVESLAVLGRFEEALEITDSEEKAAWLKMLIAAEEVDDDERCDCQATVDVADYARNPEAEPVLKSTPNYLPQFRHWSNKHRTWTWLRKCFMCGHAQTIPEEMDEKHATRVDAFAKSTEIELREGRPSSPRRPVGRK